MSLMTHKHQKGFSLLELMIVVAIIGILVAIALPQYQNYQVRSRIGDALNLVGSAKTAVGVYYSEKNNWPFNNAEAGLSDPESISSVHVREIKIQSTTPPCGIIRIRLKDISKLGAMKNESIFLTPTAPSDSEGAIQWTCGIESLDARQHLVPTVCRNVPSTTCSGAGDGGGDGEEIVEIPPPPPPPPPPPLPAKGTAWSEVLKLSATEIASVSVCWEGSVLGKANGGDGEWVVGNNTRGLTAAEKEEGVLTKGDPASANQVDQREAVRMMLAKEGKYSGDDGNRRCIDAADPVCGTSDVGGKGCTSSCANQRCT